MVGLGFSTTKYEKDKVFWLMITRKKAYPKGYKDDYGQLMSRNAKRIQATFISQDSLTFVKYYDINYYFHVREFKLVYVQNLLTVHDGVYAVEEELIHPINKVKEKLIKVCFSTYNELQVAEVRQLFNIKFVIESELKPTQKALRDNNLVVGKPYIFVMGQPTLKTTDISQYIKSYDKVLKDMDDEKLEYSKKLIENFHSELPDFRELVLAIDIEVLADVGDRINPMVAEVPVSSIGIVGANVRIVFTLNEDLLPVINPFDEPEKDYILMTYDSEYELLCAFMNYVDKRPEKFLSFYNGDGFDVPFLFVRMSYFDIPGIFMYFHEIYGNTIRWNNKYVLDLYLFFRNKTIKSGAFLGAYDDDRLDTVAQALLGEKKYEYSGKIAELSTKELAFYNIVDCELTYDLLFAWNDLPIFILFFISKISNLDLEDSNRKGITKWWGGYLSQRLFSKGWFEPNGFMLRKKDKRIKGGSVLEPVTGMYRDVSVLDFSSLYPSNQVKHNICPTTINCNHKLCFDNKFNINVDNEEIHICVKHQGVMVEALDFFRNLRVKIFKARTNPKHPEYSIFFKNISQFLKIFMNACYGCLKNYFFAFQSIEGAEATTSTSRNALDDLIEAAIKLGCVVIYGDSVAPDTAIIIKNRYGVQIMSIERLWDYLLNIKSGQVIPHNKTKEKLLLYKNHVKVWNTKEFVPMKSLVRHDVLKESFVVGSNDGAVIVTKDHSLLTRNGQMIKPEEIGGDVQPHRASFMPLETPRDHETSSKSSLFLLLFSLCGSASISYEKTKHPDRMYQRTTIKIESSERYHTQLMAIVRECRDALNAEFNVRYSISYNKKKEKYRINFSTIKGRKTGALFEKIIDTIYFDSIYDDQPKKKRVNLTNFYRLSMSDRKLIYEFLKVYRTAKSGRYKNQLFFKTNVEMTIFAAMNKVFDTHRYLFSISKKNKGYIGSRSDNEGVVVNAYEKSDLRRVYDIEADGTFGGSNYYLKNTDSIFATGVKKGFDKIISEMIDMDVENEGSWALMLIHKKKNYLLVNEDHYKIKGLTGKKRGTASINRKCFIRVLDGIKPSSTKEGLIEHIMSERNKTLLELNNLTDIKPLIYSQTINKKKCDCVTDTCKDDEHYKTNTRLVQAASILQTHLRTIIGSVDLFKAGTIIEYVMTKTGVMPESLVTIEDIDLESYKIELDKVLHQLVSPILGNQDIEIRDVIRSRSIIGLPQKHDWTKYFKRKNKDSTKSKETKD